MILLRLFFSFLKIGLFTFGGGYAMIALIHDEVVVRQGWLTPQEFTDLVAISQMTPGPIGINTATYVGYEATVNSGLPAWMGVLGSFVASFAVILLPALLMALLIGWLLRHQDNRDVHNVLKTMRLTVVGLVASAALLLLTQENFGKFGWNRQFVVSTTLFVTVFCLTMCSSKFKNYASRNFVFRALRWLSRPIPLMILAGIAGLFLYSI